MAPEARSARRVSTGMLLVASLLAACLSTHDESLGELSADADTHPVELPDASDTAAHIDAAPPSANAPLPSHDAADAAVSDAANAEDAAAESAVPHDASGDGAPDAAPRDAGRAVRDATSLECRLEPWECR